MAVVPAGVRSVSGSIIGGIRVGFLYSLADESIKQLYIFPIARFILDRWTRADVLTHDGYSYLSLCFNNIMCGV